MKRLDGRAPDQLREVEIQLGFVSNPTGSALIRTGRTLVLCTASLEKSVPAWLRGSGRGWVTAEYSMLPGSTDTRSEREAQKGKLSGRTQEIQRLIGRSLRAVIDLVALGERAIVIDCDVLQADGGTRTAAVTGGFVALAAACRRLVEVGLLKQSPLHDTVAAVSVGVVDMNVVRTGSGRLVEVQGTGEGGTFDRKLLDRMLDLAEHGIDQLAQHQARALGS